ncbi:MAG: DUF1365 domain-containing protein [Phenylobacterium sp.]|uniref:DUF1365 domain-containing protein n=1 Tax=Phenylobacterium sp. TaxID=1871053 RepID=UPI00271A0B36|nr:DUF1365 domain-containing protein [Phenylobacterium sp.]MDO8914290.1 DUF1365 domain-containing protein [Phenylobacterium sp.]MDP3102916.1 DUF1365 domain-containing protein [Phenylobacterium sp.]MDP3869532.1 DUF1365 domain-containing protein [Phenylobacterium sp.]
MFASGLYSGVTTHTRFRPRGHRLRYAIFMLLLDLDELPALDARLKAFGQDRFRLTSFSQRDHLDGSATPLKTQVEAHLAAAGIPSGGPVRLLCMPRILGGVFNPLSVYFCHRPDGALSAILYEVSNTFGERHSYLIPAHGAGVIEQQAPKAFYVSPFMDMDLAYAFRIAPPGQQVSITVDVHDAEGRLLAANFAGQRAELTDAAIWKAWLSHPLMTLGVMAAIHWEALKIWRKGEKLRPRPKAPGAPVTVVPAAQVSAA